MLIWTDRDDLMLRAYMRAREAHSEAMGAPQPTGNSGGFEVNYWRDRAERAEKHAAALQAERDRAERWLLAFVLATVVLFPSVLWALGRLWVR